MITKHEAMKARHGEEMYSMDSAYGQRSDGVRGHTREPIRARVSGRCRTWASRPEAFRLPIKIGHMRVGEVTETNAHRWTFNKAEAVRALNPPPETPVKPKPKIIWRRRKQLAPERS